LRSGFAALAVLIDRYRLPRILVLHSKAPKLIFKKTSTR
jgi:hypothetical protein